MDLVDLANVLLDFISETIWPLVVLVSVRLVLNSLKGLNHASR